MNKNSQMQNVGKSLYKCWSTLARLVVRIRNRVQNTRIVDQRRLHELWETKELKRIFELYNVDCVFDVGANEGQYARMLRSRVGFRGLIISFEPLPLMAEKLRRYAGSEANWKIEEAALSTIDGFADFNIMFASEFSSLSNPVHEEVQLFRHVNTPKQIVTVKTERLDSVLTRLQSKLGFKRPFLKLDTQGYDHAIITASQNVLPAFIGLQCELSLAKLYEASVDYKKALQDYEEMGFSLCAFVPNNVGHFPHLLEVDCIMLRTSLVK